jgi:uncharacterized membrane protein YciS (DUF1049 family)
MRWLILFILLMSAVIGVAIGALNADLVGYDLGFTRVDLPKGAALLVTLIIGWLLGGLTAWLGTRMRTRRARRSTRPGSAEGTTTRP